MPKTLWNSDIPIPFNDEGGLGFNTAAVGDLIYADTATSLAKLNIDADETKFLGISGGVPAWLPVPGSGAENPVLFEDDFIYPTVSSSTTGGTFWKANATADVKIRAAESGHPGIYNLQATSWIYTQHCVYASTGAIVFKTWVRMAGTSILDLGIGLNTNTGITPTVTPANGAVFRYSFGTDSQWTACTTNSSTATTTSTGVAVDTSWILLEIRVNAANTEYTFYINGNLVATHTTNLPGASGLQVQYFNNSNSDMYVDWMSIKQTLTGDRA